MVEPLKLGEGLPQKGFHSSVSGFQFPVSGKFLLKTENRKPKTIS